ncbi:MAG: ABC transporter substrate-binding protein [Bauldia sp.]|nr:ABC transporter substrate-binding protein [Bauldia sp.]
MSLDFSRRAVFGLAALVATGVAALPAMAQPATTETRVFVDDAGREVTIPVSPQRIVTLDAESIFPSLLELGVNVVGTIGRVNPAIFGGERYIPSVYDLFEFRWQNTDIAFVGTQGEFDIEAVAAARPDLILGRTSDLPRIGQLEAIAPTVLLSQTRVEGVAIEKYRQLADIVGMTDRFEMLYGLWQNRLERYRTVLTAAVGDPSRIVVAHIAASASGGITLRRSVGMLGDVFYDLGFSYPPILADTPALLADGAIGQVAVSPERLPEVQTDFLFTRGYFFMGANANVIADTRALFDQAAPGWTPFVHAAANSQHVFIDLGQMEPNTFSAREYTLNAIMDAILLRPFVPVAADAPRVPIRELVARELGYQP